MVSTELRRLTFANRDQDSTDGAALQCSGSQIDVGDYFVSGGVSRGMRFSWIE